MFDDEAEMTITISLKDEAAQIVQQQIADGRYPDAESAVSAALMLLDDAAIGLTDVDAEGVKRCAGHVQQLGGESPPLNLMEVKG